MNQSPGFSKRVYTLIRFFADLLYIVSKSYLMLLPKYKISHALMEKIMLAVTSVNDCRYCTWFHVRQAKKVRISQQEIQSILTHQIGQEMNPDEYPAILFAYHFAESNRKPEADMLHELQNHYGPKSKGVIYAIRMIYFGNLCGNTFDAFLSRFKGQKAAGSSFVSEAIIALLSAPVLLPLVPVLNRRKK